MTITELNALSQDEVLNKINSLENSALFSENRRAYYENGDSKLYYSLQRKMSEMANILNKQSLESIDIDDKSSKAFDRIMILMQKCETISASASALGVIAGITGNEELDTTKINKVFTPESIADAVGELAGRIS